MIEMTIEAAVENLVEAAVRRSEVPMDALSERMKKEFLSSP